MIDKKYIIQDKLGQGSFGITYVALDKKSNEQVAIKVLSLSKLDDWKKIELFEREAKILQQLDHPSIPKYIDYFKVETEENIDFCLVQQLAPGQSLATLVESGWRPDEATVKEIAEGVLDILLYLQELTPPVIHRDIKPQNIIYQPDTGKLFLVDFGAVKDTYNNTMMASTVVGTYGYMAPEQFRGGAVLSTDLYGLGCTLLFLLTGQSPAELPQRKLKIKFRSVVKIQSNFADWIEKLIEPNIEDRFQNARDAFNVLKGNVSFENYKNQQFSRPDYTSICFQEEKEKFTVIIPPVLFWNKHSFTCLAWIFYYIFVVINIFIISLSNSWLGYIYGILTILEFFSDRIFYYFQYIINFLFLLILFIIIIFVRSEIIQFIPLLIIIFDTICFHKIRIKIITSCLFTTRITLVPDLTFKCFKIKHKFEKLTIYYKDLEKAMTLQKDTASFFGLNYKFGYLLTSAEKKWLYREFKKRINL